MRMMKKNLMTLATVICCVMTTVVFTACSDKDDNPVNGIDSRIVGKWYADVSGMTYARWNYGETWQFMEFRQDGTCTSYAYFTNEGNAIGCEKLEFTYTASADGKLAMTPKEGGVLTSDWQVVGDVLRLNDEDATLELKKVTDEMAAKFDEWSNTKDVIPVPRPAKYTVFVYGNAGGSMDIAIEEGFWEQTKEFLKDHKNVRVVTMYKYGKDLPDQGAPFSGKYAEPGDIVWFELTDTTDLNKIKEQGMQGIGMGKDAIELKICTPRTLKMFMEYSSLVCPAEQYVFGVWGHGSGLKPTHDYPEKYSLARNATRGVMADEWNADEELDMYELHDAIKAAGFNRLNTIFFHNCMMGNLETVTEVKDCADYICCSEHVLTSGGEVMTEFVRGLIDKGNAEDAVAQMFDNLTPEWQNGYNGGEDNYANGDYKMFATAKFDAVLDAIKKLSERLVALYPTQKEAIDRATKQVYRVDELDIDQYLNPFFDMADYAHLLAKETGDDEMKTISDELDNAFKEAFIHYRDVNWCGQHLDHYTLSVCLVYKGYYTYDFKTSLSFPHNFNEGYEQCSFHKYTGWGNWLGMNEQSLDSNPQNKGGGLLK